MKKIKKYIKDIKNFFNIGDIKTIFITLIFILILVLLCKGSTVEAYSVTYNDITFECDDNAYNTFKTFDEYKSGNYHYVIYRWQDLWRCLFIPKEAFDYTKFYFTFGSGNGHILSTTHINDTMHYYRLDSNCNIAYTNLSFTSSVDEFVSTGDHSVALIASFDIYTDSTCSTLLYNSDELYKDTNLQLSVSTTELTQNFVTIETQVFSEEYRNRYKCYYSYSYDVYGKRKWFLADVNTKGSYYAYALENGTYVFKLDDLEGNTVSTASVKITNISTVTENIDNSVLMPILSVEPITDTQVRIKTQSFNEDLINKYRCFWWISGETPDYKKEALPSKLSDNNYYFYTVTEEDNTFYFMFYDIEKNKYSNIASLTVDVENVLAYADEYGTIKTMDNLLHRKFGFFYDCYDFLNDTYKIIIETEPEPPVFEVTLPTFLGGQTYTVLDLQFYAQYRTYIHYIMAGIIYFIFCKRMVKSLPHLIHS